MSIQLGVALGVKARRDISKLATGIAGEALWPSLLEALNKVWKAEG
jgi:hypothetical protein